MCGIAGIIKRSDGDDPHVIRARIKAMLDIQAHRGPDDRGDWLKQLGNIWVSLGHCRLAVIDLSYAGHQPMVSTCGRYVLVYNGELYNYIELRKDLKKYGVKFYTNSDTEVVLQALIKFGEKAFEYFNGMWALALIDLNKRKLILEKNRIYNLRLLVSPALVL